MASLRLKWEEVVNIIKRFVKDKYNIEGDVIILKDYGCEGIREHYDYPDYIEIHNKD